MDKVPQFIWTMSINHMIRGQKNKTTKDKYNKQVEIINYKVNNLSKTELSK